MKRILMAAACAAVLFSCSPKKAEQQNVTLFDAKDFTAVVDGKQTSLYTLKAGDLVMQVTDFG